MEGKFQQLMGSYFSFKLLEKSLAALLVVAGVSFKNTCSFADTSADVLLGAIPNIAFRLQIWFTLIKFDNSARLYLIV
jgi:hypothetical protein